MSDPFDSRPYPPRGPRRLGGLAVVVLLHAAVLWALLSGVGKRVVETVKKPIQVAILPEAPPPPPPPPLPTPKVERPLPRPPVAPPPRPPSPAPYLPPAQVQPPAAPPPPITVTQPLPVPPAEAKPNPPPTPPAPPAPPLKAEIGLACPGYDRVLRTALATAYERVGIEGRVVVNLRVRGNQIVEVVPMSGPREYYRMVQSAARRMTCTVSGADEVIVPLTVEFKEE